MSNPFVDGADPFDITVTASRGGDRAGGWSLIAILENGTADEGGEVELLVTDSAKRAYGLGACVDEFERYLNTTLGREYRLAAALAMGEQGGFTVISTADGPSVLSPPAASDLAA
jgi:hypothetical protein